MMTTKLHISYVVSVRVTNESSVGLSRPFALGAGIFC